MQFVPEEGSPISVDSVRSEMDLDPFGAPTNIRTYADYRNTSGKPIVGVKFRIRYVDAEGKDRGTFHAPHGMSLLPGASGTEKWRTERVDPRVVGMLMRVLAVKFADGSVWESSKAGNIIKPGGARAAPVQGSVPAEDPQSAPVQQLVPESPGSDGSSDAFNEG